jgi:hypothetical protein
MYTRVAPHPENWSKLVQKSVEAVTEFKGWQKKDLRTINAPTLVMVGDRDIVRAEHAVELYRLIPQATLAILPATDHIGILFQRAEWLTAMMSDFLDAAPPAETPKADLEEGEHDFPKHIGRTATSALLAAGYTRLEQLTKVRETDIKMLHGVGPKALNILRTMLAEKGLAFTDKRS